ncbi:NAM-associated domain-containing protein [Heracleum sosnowskyi]|uniref:NAM-associated domain-containing protein n=1 Tax=Heracleum sosnowskyi TaxID=360622 RepID=A0AAD8NEB6_9APIA|nr:NAM-associated domain-containing protein [Heracleum sosnowskyi]
MEPRPKGGMATEMPEEAAATEAIIDIIHVYIIRNLREKLIPQGPKTNHLSTKIMLVAQHKNLGIILSVIGKLRGCVRQIQNQNPSGACQIDILNRAKVVLEQDKKYDKDFKFDHEDILKDTYKFRDDHSNATPYHQTQTSKFVSSQANSPATQSLTTSPRFPPFFLNINDTSIDGCLRTSNPHNYIYPTC